MAKQIIIKPLLSEKTTALFQNPKLNQYTFVVAIDANRIEVKNAVEKQFGVNVVNVNISIRPGKVRSRTHNQRRVSGMTSPQKKAYVTVQQGQIIDDFYGVDKSAETQETPTTENNAVANA